MNFMSSLESKIMVVGEKLNNNRVLKVLRDAFMLVFPMTIFGSIMLIIANFPYLNVMIGDEAVATLQELLGPASTCTMSIATVFVTMGIGYYMSKELEVDGIYGAAIALTAFFLLTPAVAPIDESGQMLNNVFNIDRLGAKGMFVGMICGFISAYLYAWVTHKNWTIKMPPQVPPAVAKSFSALIPAFLTLLLFLVLRIVFTFTPWGNVHDFIYNVIQSPLTNLGKGLAATIIAILACQFLWFFGLHGQIIVNSVMDPIWNTLTLENLSAFQAGQAVPNLVTKQFVEIFTVGLGGTGMTLAVVLTMLFLMKSRQLREVGKLAAPAGIFNVNEPVIFGLPIVLNPMVLIPWVLAPIVSLLFAYFMMATGLCPYTTGVTVPWTTPVLLSGFLATNSIMGSVVQLGQMAIVFVIWFPFLKALDRNNLRDEAVSADADEDMDLGLDDEDLML